MKQVIAIFLDNPHVRRILIIALFLILITVFLNQCGYISKKSKVDASPLAELSVEQVYRLEEVIMSLIYDGQYDFITENRNYYYGGRPNI